MENSFSTDMPMSQSRYEPGDRTRHSKYRSRDKRDRYFALRYLSYTVSFISSRCVSKSGTIQYPDVLKVFHSHSVYGSPGCVETFHRHSVMYGCYSFIDLILPCLYHK